MKARKLFAYLFVGLLGFSFILSLAPIARAAGFDSTCIGNSVTGTVTCTIPTIANGDTVVIALQETAPAACPTFTNAMATDSQSLLVFTLAASQCNQVTTKFDTAIWYAPYGGASTLTNDIITIAPAQGAGQDSVEGYAVIGLTAAGVTSSTDSGTISSASATDLFDTVTSFALNNGFTLWSGTGWSIGIAAGSWAAVPSTYTVQQAGTGTGQCNLNYAAAGNQLRGAGCSAYAFITSGSSVLLAQIHSAGTGVASTEIGVSFALSASGPTTQTQTVGTCTAAASGGTYLTNSTQYWYAGNSLGQELVNTVQTQVENIKGSGSHTLQFVIYVTAANAAAQAPSASYPAILAYSASFVIATGTTNATITVNVAIPLNTANLSPLPFNYWAVGIVGDDHIRIHNSALSGLVTQSGNAATAAQPSQFTGPGSASAVKLALCATGQYQSVITGPTTTITAPATSTSVVTVTSTVNTIGPQLFSTQSNWPVIFLILLLPAGLFLGVTKTLAGALLGLMVGSVIGLMMGIIPGFVFIGIVIALAAIAFIARNNSG